jgi:hypothetical protein
MRRVSRCQISVAYWWDNEITDQGISLCDCFLNTTWVSPGGDVQFRGN